MLQILLSLLIIAKGLIFKTTSFQDILNYFADNEYWRIFWNCNHWTGGDVNVFGDLLQYTGPILLPFWYIRDLMVLCLLAPLIYYFIKSKYLWILLFVAYIVNISFRFLDVQIVSVFFFCIGAYVAIHKIDIIGICRKFRIPLVVLFSVLTLTIVCYAEQRYSWQMSLFNLYIIIAIMAVLAIADRGIAIEPKSERTTLSEMSFFVYASHPLLILYLSQLILSKALPFDSVIVRTFNYLMAPLLTVAVCCLIYILMKRYCRTALNMLTGGRN